MAATGPGIGVVVRRRLLNINSNDRALTYVGDGILTRNRTGRMHRQGAPLLIVCLAPAGDRQIAQPPEKNHGGYDLPNARL